MVGSGVTVSAAAAVVVVGSITIIMLGSFDGDDGRGWRGPLEDDEVGCS
jgi:hypothetical protein